MAKDTQPQEAVIGRARGMALPNTKCMNTTNSDSFVCLMENCTVASLANSTVTIILSQPLKRVESARREFKLRSTQKVRVHGGDFF